MGRKKNKSVDFLDLPDHTVKVLLSGYCFGQLKSIAKLRGVDAESLARDVINGFLDKPSNHELKAGQWFRCNRFHGIRVAITRFHRGEIDIVDMGSGLHLVTIGPDEWDNAVDTFGLEAIDRPEWNPQETTNSLTAVAESEVKKTPPPRKKRKPSNDAG
jgi:hypothetical protein